MRVDIGQSPLHFQEQYVINIESLVSKALQLVSTLKNLTDKMEESNILAIGKVYCMEIWVGIYPIE